MNLKTQGGFPVKSEIRLCEVLVPLNYPWDVPHWPVLVGHSDSESSDSESSDSESSHSEFKFVRDLRD
jgi:hypothetical protein